MSQSANYSSAYSEGTNIIPKPYAHGENGTASWYSSKGGSKSSKGGSKSSKGGSKKTRRSRAKKSARKQSKSAKKHRRN
jgi:hypothetical protein